MAGAEHRQAPLSITPSILDQATLAYALIEPSNLLSQFIRHSRSHSASAHGSRAPEHRLRGCLEYRASGAYYVNVPERIAQQAFIVMEELMGFGPRNRLARQRRASG
jgi:hypothetical protein